MVSLLMMSGMGFGLGCERHCEGCGRSPRVRLNFRDSADDETDRARGGHDLAGERVVSIMPCSLNGLGAYAPVPGVCGCF